KECRDTRYSSKRDIDVTECPQNKDRWNNKKGARCDPAARLVQEPADVDGELLRFRTGKQHAEIQCVQKPRIVDPALFLDQLGVHHGDLTARSAKGNKAKLQPKPQRFPKGRRTMSILDSVSRFVHTRRRNAWSASKHWNPRRRIS